MDRRRETSSAGWQPIQKVTGAAHRLQMNRIFRIHFNFFPQSANVHVHAARRYEAIGAPDGVEQLIAREHAVGACSQIVDQPKFQRAQRQRLAGSRDAIGRGIDREPPHFDGAFDYRPRVRRGEAEPLLVATNSRGLNGLVT